jgi:hypothetical protein
MKQMALPKKKGIGMNSFGTTMHRRQDDKEYHVTSIQQCDGRALPPTSHFIINKKNARSPMRINKYKPRGI